MYSVNFGSFEALILTLNKSEALYLLLLLFIYFIIRRAVVSGHRWGFYLDANNKDSYYFRWYNSHTIYKQKPDRLSNYYNHCMFHCNVSTSESRVWVREQFSTVSPKLKRGIWQPSCNGTINSLQPLPICHLTSKIYRRHSAGNGEKSRRGWAPLTTRTHAILNLNSRETVHIF